MRLTIKKYTLGEYFELERNSEERWEFWDGHVWAMAGASFAHEDIVANTLRAIGNNLPPGCRISVSNVKVRVPIYPPYRYPDMTIVCGKRDAEMMDGLEVLLNPQVIFEVLSVSTEAFDRGAKFTYYKSISSLKEYVLISAVSPHITHFSKQAENEWVNRDIVGREAFLQLATIDVSVPLSDIYLDIEFQIGN